MTTAQQEQEQVWALVDGDGNVINTIVADDDFIKALPALVDDDSVDTGDLPKGVKGYDVTDLDERPVPGDHKRASNGRWTLREGVKERKDKEALEAQESAARAQAEAAKRAGDDAFLDEVGAKARSKKPLTQDERDRMQLIALARGQAQV